MRRASILFAMMVIAVTLAAQARAEDRYGAPLAGGGDAPEPLQTLTWPGKAAGVSATALSTRRDPAYVAPPPAPPRSLYDPPPPRWRAAEAAPMPAAAPALFAPTTPSSAQPAAAQRDRTKAADGAPPHFYSLARQYGVEPDPIALSPQFLAASPQADMAEPPPLPPPHTIGAQSANMSTAAATSQVRQAQEAAADANAATLGN